MMPKNFSSLRDEIARFISLSTLCQHTTHPSVDVLDLLKENHHSWQDVFHISLNVKARHSSCIRTMGLVPMAEMDRSYFTQKLGHRPIDLGMSEKARERLIKLATGL